MENAAASVELEWPRRRSQNEALAFALPANHFASTSPAISTSASSMLRTTKWPLG